MKSAIVSARLQIILYSLLAGFSPKTARIPAADNLANQPVYEIIRRVAEKVSANIDRQIDVNAAADEVGISASYLQKIFHKTFGIGVGTYIRRHKIFQAARLLVTTGMNVSEISDKCGFDSLYSFSRTFKAIMKTSPRDFRNNSTSRVGNAYS